MGKADWSNGQTPLWYRVLREFGFPTLVAVGLALAFVYFYKEVQATEVVEQTQRQKHHAEYIEALTGIRLEQRSTNEKLDRLIDGHD